MADVEQSCDVYTIGNYNFGTKPADVEYDGSSNPDDIAKRYEAQGMARKVRAVILVHLHNHPHVLLLKRKASEAPNKFELPGGLLDAGEAEAEGLQRILAGLLSPLPEQPGSPVSYQPLDLLATWWRPHYTPPMFPYLPVHVSYPRQSTKIFLVELSARGSLAVPRSFELRAVSMYELFNNASYGALLSTIPQLVSRFKLHTNNDGGGGGGGGGKGGAAADSSGDAKAMDTTAN